MANAWQDPVTISVVRSNLTFNGHYCEARTPETEAYETN